MYKIDLSQLARNRINKFRLEDLLETIGELLRKGYVECIDSLENIDNYSKLIVSLYLLGCRHIYVCGGKKRIYSLEELGFYEDITPSPLRVFESTEELLYRNWPTPLVKLRSLSNKRYSVWAKLEFYNPFSMSVKDRIGWYMIRSFLENSSTGSEKKIFYEATSTNTGMALTSIASLVGYSTKLYLPSTIQKASDVILKVMGAEVNRRPERLTTEFIDYVDKLAKEEKGVHLNQFMNDANFLVHLRYTAKELDLQIRYRGLRLRALLAGIGTSGHFSALSHYLKNRYGDHVKTYAIQPAPNETIPGIRRIETGMKWIHLVKYDGIIDVSLKEAINEAVEIARREGLFIGLSSGAVVAGFKKIAEMKEPEEGDYILVFPDHGFKYIEQFMQVIK